MEYVINIYCGSEALKRLVGTKIHDQLKGNPDYIDSRIILNIDAAMTVTIWIDSDASIPSCLDMRNINKIANECKELMK